MFVYSKITLVFKDKFKKLSKRLVFGFKLNKPCILFRFDAFLPDDERLNVMLEYGLTGTFIWDIFKGLDYSHAIDNGFDYALYSYKLWPYDEYDEKAYINNDLTKKAWDIYVKNALDVFSIKYPNLNTPDIWFCRRCISCNALNDTLRKYKFKMAIGENINSMFNKIFFGKHCGFNINNIGLYPGTYNKIISAIDYAISHKCAVSILTHNIYDNKEDAIKNYGCTYDDFLTLIKYVSDLKHEGKIDVLTYHQFIDKYNS